MSVTLPLIYHDPQGKLTPLFESVLPLLHTTYDHIVGNASAVAAPAALALFRAHQIGFNQPLVQ